MQSGEESSSFKLSSLCFSMLLMHAIQTSNYHIIAFTLIYSCMSSIDWIIII